MWKTLSLLAVTTGLVRASIYPTDDPAVQELVVAQFQLLQLVSSVTEKEVATKLKCGRTRKEHFPDPTDFIYNKVLDKECYDKRIRPHANSMPTKVSFISLLVSVLICKTTSRSTFYSLSLQLTRLRKQRWIIGSQLGCPKKYYFQNFFF